MVAIPYPSAERRRHAASIVAATAAVLLAFIPGAAGARPDLEDRPVTWYEDDRRDIPEPAERKPSLMWTGIDESFGRPIGRVTNPGRFLRRVGVLFGGDHVPPAANVNALDEVPNSSWFTNRIGIYPWTAEDVARLTGEGVPDTSAPWTVTSAKTAGVTPGFNIQDARGHRFVIKFDPPKSLGMVSGNNVLVGRILNAVGYNVSDDGVVSFSRANVVLGPDVKIKLPDGTKRRMTDADIDDILAKVDRLPDGRYRANTSRFLVKGVGPFDYKGRRKDDPNDTVNHEDRRELRGLRMICAWLDHFDMKQYNDLDVYVEDGGRHYVRHYLIDFGSTLGAGSSGPFPQYNWEYAFDAPSMGGRLLGLGFHEDAWRRIHRPPGLAEVGYFESDLFDPIEWKPLNPNTAFANLTDRDGYWAAKIISAFTDPMLLTVAETGQFQNPATAKFIARTLGERRDRIARFWFDRVPPLDFFTFENGRLRFHDLGAERNIYRGAAPRYRVRIAAADASREAATRTDWILRDETTADAPGAALDQVSPERAPFLGFECQVDRGSGFGPSVTAWVARASGRVVAVDR